MLGMVAALLITVGLLVVTLRLLGRLQGAGTAARSGAMMQVVERIGTGPRQGVVLLRVGSRVMVVGSGEGQPVLLGELDGTDREAAIAATSRSSGITRSLTAPVGQFRTVLSRVGLMLALAAAPAVANAQEITAPAPTVTSRQTPQAAGPVVAGPTSPTAPQVNFSVGSGAGKFELSGAVGVVVMMGVLTILPALFLMMTGFARILIVLSFLRSAIGTQSAPPTQLLVAIAVILTAVVMRPTLEEANTTALQPYLRGEIGQVEAYQQAVIPMREFMLANTRDRDLAVFAEMTGTDSVETIEELPTMTVVSAFVTSELRTAFQMGFVLFIPFLVIDLIVASVLMSMGMFMLPPVMVSLPFKLLLFVLADGWALVMQNLVSSFRMAA